MLWVGVGRHRLQLHSPVCLAVYSGLGEHWIWLVISCAHAGASSRVRATERARPVHVPCGGPARPAGTRGWFCGGPWRWAGLPELDLYVLSRWCLCRPGWQACCFHLFFILCSLSQITLKRKISTASKYLLPGQVLCNSPVLCRDAQTNLWNFSQSIHKKYFSAT